MKRVLKIYMAKIEEKCHWNIKTSVSIKVWDKVLKEVCYKVSEKLK